MSSAINTKLQPQEDYVSGPHPVETIGSTMVERCRSLRLMIMKHLGNKCNECGHEDLRVLQIHHLRGNGNEARQQNDQLHYYRRILKEIELGKKGDYQLLCANCHWLKRPEFQDSKPYFPELPKTLPLSIELLYYAAWIIDGMGNMGIYLKIKKIKRGKEIVQHFYMSPSIEINGNMEFCQRLQKTLGIGKVYPRNQGESGRWILNSQKDIRVLLDSITFLFPTQRNIEKAVLIREWCRLRKDGTLKKTPYDKRCREIIRELEKLNNPNQVRRDK